MDEFKSVLNKSTKKADGFPLENRSDQNKRSVRLEIHKTKMQTHGCGKCGCKTFPDCTYLEVDYESETIGNVDCLCSLSEPLIFPTLKKLCMDFVISTVTQNINTKQMDAHIPDKDGFLAWMFFDTPDKKPKQRIEAPDLTDFRQRITEVEHFSILSLTIQYDLLDSVPLVPECLVDHYKCNTCKLTWYEETDSCDFCFISEE